MKITAGLILLVLAAGFSGCDKTVTGPTPTPTATPPPSASPAPGNSDPPFHVAEVTLSGVVFEMTTGGRMPIAGVNVLNGEGNYATTDVNGFYSLGPVWVCPCAAQPWIEAGTTFLWITKDGYMDPPGTPGSVFGNGSPSPGTRDVKIDGDTRFDIELVPSPFTQRVSNTVPASSSSGFGVFQFDLGVPRSGTATVTLTWPDADYSLDLYLTDSACADTTSLVTGACTILGTSRGQNPPEVVMSAVRVGHVNRVWVLNHDDAPQSFTVDIEIK